MYFTPSYSVCIVEFEQSNVAWGITIVAPRSVEQHLFSQITITCCVLGCFRTKEISEQGVKYLQS